MINYEYFVIEKILQNKHNDWVYCIKIIDDKYLFTSSKDGDVFCWNIDDCSLVYQI